MLLHVNRTWTKGGMMLTYCVVVYACTREYRSFSSKGNLSREVHFCALSPEPFSETASA